MNKIIIGLIIADIILFILAIYRKYKLNKIKKERSLISSDYANRFIREFILEE